MKKMFLIVVIFAAAVSVSAQTPNPPQGPVLAPEKVTPKVPYDSTKAQLAYEKEKNLQLTSQSATDQYHRFVEGLQKKYADEEASISTWVESVRKANGWDDTYLWDREKDEWTHDPKNPVPPPNPKK